MIVPAKAMYMAKDLQRSADYWSVKIKPPKNPTDTILNKGSMLAQRFLTVIDMEEKDHLEQAARELWERVWLRNETIHNVEDLEVVRLRFASSKTSLPNGAALIAKCGSEAVKEMLKKRTETAVKQGCFGAPWIVVHKDQRELCFFGSDRLPLIAHTIGCAFQGPQPQP
ncbi:unnamed protein product [Anisakis simplex]|uniref:Glutathione S-transferase kappa 1 n=1 Tax=Anisakis simplex TaxID=6269 RepID=A0A0M3K209_ANISI|nr:unnamed protein product [Anisakis simplex]